MSLRRNVITQLLSRCLQVGPKQSIHKMGPQSFSTEQHVFCPTESSSGLIRILYSCSVKDYSFFFFFKYNSRESVFFFKDVFSDYISFPLGIKKWRSILKQSVTKIEVGRTFQNTRPLNFSYREKQNKKQTNKQTKTRSQESLQTSVCSDTEPEQVWVPQICGFHVDHKLCSSYSC